MSRHRRQQRKRANRTHKSLTWAQAERFARALEGIQPPEPFDPNAYVFRQSAPTMCTREQVEEFFGSPLPEYPRGPDYSNHPAIAAADALFAALGFHRVEPSGNPT